MRENSLMIRVENVKKQYRLGQIGGGTLRGDLQSWWARKRGKEDPNTLIGTDQRVFVKLHVPRIGVEVGGFQGSGSLHGGDILCGKLAFSALTAEPLHGRCHHGSCVVIR